MATLCTNMQKSNRINMHLYASVCKYIQFKMQKYADYMQIYAK